MKRWLILILGLIMATTLTGCTRKSEAEIQEEFLDYLSLFPVQNFMVLYDTEGDMVNSELGREDLGVWECCIVSGGW